MHLYGKSIHRAPTREGQKKSTMCVQVEPGTETGQSPVLVSPLPHPQGKLFWLNHLSEGPRGIKWKCNLSPAISHIYICTGLAPLAQGASNQTVLRLDQQDQTEGFLNILRSVGSKSTGMNSGEQQLSEVTMKPTSQCAKQGGAQPSQNLLFDLFRTVRENGRTFHTPPSELRYKPGKEENLPILSLSGK